MLGELHHTISRALKGGGPKLLSPNTRECIGIGDGYQVRAHECTRMLYNFLVYGRSGSLAVFFNEWNTIAVHDAACLQANFQHGHETKMTILNTNNHWVLW